MKLPPVTVVCATHNARDAVRLTFASLFRHNDATDMLVYVADNGSTDGALDEVRRYPTVDVVTLPQRVALIAREAKRPRHMIDVSAVGEHGATLDWLVARVATRYTLVLDSDVEFLASGVIADLVERADSSGVAAIGAFEPGWHGYQPRLAPYLLLLRTETIRGVQTSFRGYTEIGDAAEHRRWSAKGERFEVSPAEFATYRSVRTYPTAAAFFAGLVRGGHRWCALPADVADRVRHYGHMSWGTRTDADGGSARARESVTAAERAIARALVQYADECSPPT